MRGRPRVELFVVAHVPECALRTEGKASTPIISWRSVLGAMEYRELWCWIRQEGKVKRLPCKINTYHRATNPSGARGGTASREVK